MVQWTVHARPIFNLPDKANKHNRHSMHTAATSQSRRCRKTLCQCLVAGSCQSGMQSQSGSGGILSKLAWLGQPVRPLFLLVRHGLRWTTYISVISDTQNMYCRPTERPNIKLNVFVIEHRGNENLHIVSKLADSYSDLSVLWQTGIWNTVTSNTEILPMLKPDKNYFVAVNYLISESFIGCLMCLLSCLHGHKMMLYYNDIQLCNLNWYSSRNHKHVHEDFEDIIFLHHHSSHVKVSLFI